TTTPPTTTDDDSDTPDTITDDSSNEDDDEVTVPTSTIGVGNIEITSPDVIEVERGDSATMFWEVTGAETITIDYLDQEVSSVGSFDFVPKEDFIIRITAINELFTAHKDTYIKIIDPKEGGTDVLSSIQDFFGG